MGGNLPPSPAIPFRFRFAAEERPGSAWLALFERAWPSYRSWFLKEGDRKRPSLKASREALERHMPELLPLWNELVELAGGDPLVARMLGLYRPTPYMAGCSQAVWSRGEPLLVRNYDYHPSACEGLFLHSAWGGTRCLVSSDCLWGVLDGMNEHGLAVSLAFGGRREVGDGFGIPLILRYVLDTCRTTVEAADVLTRVPSHMSYNVSLLDASGDSVVAAVAPDRSTFFVRGDVATNHQRGGEWSRHGKMTRSAERETYLCGVLANKRVTPEGFIARFLRSPLYSTRYDRAFGTIYTAVYRPGSLRASYLWPGQVVEQSFEAYEPRELDVLLGAKRK